MRAITHSTTKVARGVRAHADNCAASASDGLLSPDGAPSATDARVKVLQTGDAMLFRIIAEGQRHPFNKSDRLTMPAFGESLTDQEIGSAIEYLKTLWTNEQREYHKTESQ